MKLQKPPSVSQLMYRFNIRDVLDVPKELIDTFNSKYIHWNKLRRYPPRLLAGNVPDRIWLALKMSRISMSQFLPFTDTHGNKFSYAITPSVLHYLHQIDHSMGGMVLSDFPTLRGNQSRYLLNSLMEEAIASSQLEGASTTRQRAKQMLRRKREPRDTAERMILNNYKTIRWLRERTAEDLTLDLILDLHTSMTEGTMNDEDVGRLRLDSDDVHVADRATGEIVHVPPPAYELAERIEALCDFASRRQSAEETSFLHPVLRAIIVHFWLAYDHPFVDGNGRTARALFYWTMLRHGYWVFEFLPISRVILRAPAQYGRAFIETETDDADVTYFIMHNLRAVASAKEDLKQYLTEKQREAKTAREILRDSDEFNHRQQTLLLEAVQDNGKVWTLAEHATRWGVTLQTARRDLYELRDKGMLRMFKIGRAFAFEPTGQAGKLASLRARPRPLTK
jgi:Fic family protein